MAQIAQEPSWQGLTTPLFGAWAWLMTVIQMKISPTATLYRRRIRAAWRVLHGREAYRGAPYLPDAESIPWQWQMAAALGGSDRALLLIKFVQWSNHNEGEGRSHDTYNGYSEWAANHFGHLSDASIGYHVRALEEMGVIVTERVGRAGPGKAYDQRKRYRIDYTRLNELLSKVKTPKSEVKSADKSPKTGDSNFNMPSQSLNNDSKSPNQSLKTKSLPKASTQEQPTKPGRGGRRAGAGRKAKDKSALTDTTAATAASPVLASGDVPEPASVEANMGDANAEGPSPRSEAPSSHPEAALMERLINQGLDEGKALALIDTHGADRVRAVEHKCAQRQRHDSRESPIDRPAGWIVAELKNDIFKLGEMTQGEHPADRWESASVDGDDAGNAEALAGANEILVVTPTVDADDYQNRDVVEITPETTTEARAREVWSRVMNDLHEYCGQAADVIRRRVQLVAVEGDVFLVSASDDQALAVLKREAGTLKLRLTSIMRHDCRIKHFETGAAAQEGIE
jgi:DNA-binding transcriptional ArsR family regulator